MKYRVGLVALGLALVAGCSERPEPYYPPDPDASAAATEYDPSLAPSAAVLSLVPEEAQVLEVTDFDQIRLTLGFGNLIGASPQGERAQFWRGFGRSAAFSDGMLRADAGALARFDLSQDDVAWEAHFRDGAEGWIVVFHDEVPTARIRRAVQAGAGPLRGAVLDEQRGIVSSAELPDPEESWGADQELTALVGREANATYVERGCVPLDGIYGDGIVDQLDGQTEVDVASLRDLTNYSVSIGGELATVQIGTDRDDVFTRLRLAEHLPELSPEFAQVFARGAADPGSGRLGYDVPRPRLAADWTHERRLPFAACDT